MSFGLFPVSHLLQDVEHSLKRSLFPSEIPMQNTTPFIYKWLSIGNSFRTRDGCLPLLSDQRPHLVQTTASPIFAATVSVSLQTSQCCYVQKVLFLWCPPSTLVLTLFPTSPSTGMSPVGKDLMKTSHLVMNVLRSLTL